MRVLLLGPARPALEARIASLGDELVRTEARLDSDDPLLAGADFLISYGFRHLIPASVLAPFGERAINLHISLLPWNRGADPNLWSYLEDTPKGVSIHVLDVGLDTGPLIAQREVCDEPDDTLKTSYERLVTEIEALFCEVWPDVRASRVVSREQQGGGSVHRSADKQPYKNLLTVGWDTPVSTLRGVAIAKER